MANPEHAPRGQPPPSAPLRLGIEEITRPADLDGLADEWAALFERCPKATPFQSPQWLLAWREAFLDEGLWALGVRRAGRLVGLAPFFIFTTPEGVRQLTLLGNGVSDRLDLLAPPEEADAVGQAVFAHLSRRTGLWDTCDLRDLAAGSPLLRPPAPVGRGDRIEPDAPCPVVTLPARADEVLLALSKSRRADLERCARRLGELGPWRIETADRRTRPRFFEHLLALHDLRWASKGEPGVLSDPRVRRFHGQATSRLLEAAMLRLQVLVSNGQAIAAHYGLVRGERAYSYLHSFDPAFAAYGPGRLLIAQAMREAVEAGAREFDFLRGQEPYKYEWGAVDRPQYRRRLWRTT